MSYLPKALTSRFNTLSNFSRESIQILPASGMGSVNAGQTVIVDLPYSSVLQLDSLAMSFDFETSANDNDVAADGNEILFAPRNSASLIEILKFVLITL